MESTEEMGLDYTSSQGMYESMEHYIKSGIDNAADDNVDDSALPLVILHRIIAIHNEYYDKVDPNSAYRGLIVSDSEFYLLSSIEEYLELMGTYAGARLENGRLVQDFKEDGNDY